MDFQSLLNPPHDGMGQDVYEKVFGSPGLQNSGSSLRVHFFECVSISRISVPFNGHFLFALVNFKNNLLFCIKLHIRALLLQLKTLKKLDEKLFFRN